MDLFFHLELRIEQLFSDSRLCTTIGVAFDDSTSKILPTILLY